MIDQRLMDLCRLGKEAFLRAAPPAVLYRRREQALRAPRNPRGTMDFDSIAALLSLDAPTTSVSQNPRTEDTPRPAESGGEVFALVKRPGVPFSDMITVGRTANNDVVVSDVTVSRFHAYFREQSGAWVVCDAGSKNGTRLDGEMLEPRRDQAVASGQIVRVGDVETTFFIAADLYEILARSL
ncbi:MAG TPA: FHA domain-containing protein [Kofleriaceae bacterium]|nr:FHA domain-containing protein [Kofleriaceae bacterium]